jgi:hypothetical protein
VHEILRANWDLDVLALEPNRARFAVLMSSGAGCRQTTLEGYADNRATAV